MSFVDVKGIRTFYHEYGNAKGEDVIFLHGLGSSSIVWRDIPDALSRHFHTIAVDLVGFGLSEKPKESEYYTIEGFSKFIIDFLETIGSTKEEASKISLIGHSLGGYIAAQVATQLKEKIKRVLEDMYASPSRLLPIAVDLFNYIIEKQGARYAFELTFKNSTTTQIKLEGFRVIQDVQCLVLWGEKDNLIPIRYYDMFRQKLPKANCEVIPDAGHAPFIEKTALFYEKLSTFLS